MNGFMGGTLGEVERLIWSGRLDEAEKLIRRGYGGRVTRPRTELTHGHVWALRMWICGRDENAKNLIARCDAAIHAAEITMKSGRWNSQFRDADAFDLEDSRLVLAEALLFKSVGHFFLGQNLKGIFAFRSSFKEYEKELERVSNEFRRSSHRDPRAQRELPPAAEMSPLEVKVCLEKGERDYVGFPSCWRFGLGFFLLYLSMAPPQLIKLLEIAGFVSDRQLGYGLLGQGVAMLTDQISAGGKALPVGSLFALHAQLWYLFEFSEASFIDGELDATQRYALGEDLANAVEKVCPDSIIWTWVRMIGLRQQGEFRRSNDRILAVYKAFAEANSPVPIISRSRITQDVQVNALLSGSYDAAAKLADEALKTPDGRKSSAILASATLGVVQLLKGDARAADATFRAALAWSNFRLLTETENVVASRLKHFGNRKFGAVALGELILCVGATEWMLPLDALRRGEILLDAIREMERAGSGPAKPSKFLSISIKVPILPNADRSRYEELAAAYVVAASMFRRTLAGNQGREDLLRQALVMTKKALELPDIDKWTRVFANYERAQLKALHGDFGEARELLSRTSEVNRGFEGERSMETRIHRLRASIAERIADLGAGEDG